MRAVICYRVGTGNTANNQMKDDLAALLTTHGFHRRNLNNYEANNVTPAQLSQALEKFWLMVNNHPHVTSRRSQMLYFWMYSELDDEA